MRAKYAIFIFCVSATFYALMSYGGVRAPDSEVVFRAGESLESHFALDVKEDMEDWQGFGVAQGKDGKLYSVFGPAQSILGAGLIRLARIADYRAWTEDPALSFFLHDGLAMHLAKVRPADVEIEPHALRFAVSYLYVIVSALGALVFFLVIQKMISSPRVSLVVALLYGFGTPALAYSGTFLSEPLATLFLLASFYFLISRDPHFQTSANSKSDIGLLASGLCLGISVAAHITAVLFFPFFLFYCSHYCGTWTGRWKESVKPVALFVAGFAILCLLLGYYNYFRFGNVLETGRTVNMYDNFSFGYGRSVAPWVGLYGLILGPGKGLLLYCPAVILGIVSWRKFHRDHPVLSFTLAGAAVFRIIFIATRSDWHGGFCLGPRFLLLLIPFLLIPFAYLLRDMSREKRKTARIAAAATLFVCISQQIYFSIGDMCSYFHIMKWKKDTLDVHRLYLEWSSAPLVNILKFQRGPFLLREVPLSNETIWLIATGLLALALGAGLLFLPSRRDEEA